MTFALFAEIIAKEGLPLALSLWQSYQDGKANSEVLPSDITALTALNNYTSADALKQAGIAIVDGKVVKLTP